MGKLGSIQECARLLLGWPFQEVSVDVSFHITPGEELQSMKFSYRARDILIQYISFLDHPYSKGLLSIDMLQRFPPYMLTCPARFRSIRCPLNARNWILTLTSWDRSIDPSTDRSHSSVLRILCGDMMHHRRSKKKPSFNFAVFEYKTRYRNTDGIYLFIGPKTSEDRPVLEDRCVFYSSILPNTPSSSSSLRPHMTVR